MLKIDKECTISAEKYLAFIWNKCYNGIEKCPKGQKSISGVRYGNRN